MQAQLTKEYQLRIYEGNKKKKSTPRAQKKKKLREFYGERKTQM